MDKRIIRSRLELPDWYSLDKYKDVDRLDCLGWYWQLEARCHLWHFVVWNVDDSFFDRFSEGDPVVRKAKENRNASKALLETVRTYPIIDDAATCAGRKFLGQVVSPPNPGMAYASLADVNRQLFFLRTEEQGEAIKRLNGRNSVDGDALSTAPLIDLQRERLDEMLIKVRTDLPERLLVESFTTFIRKVKEDRNEQDFEKPRYRKPDFKEWARVGILPYLDLRIWAMQENLSVPNRVMADAIFAEGEGGEEVVRKTTEKLAHQIVDGEIISNLAALSLAEKLGVATP